MSFKNFLTNLLGNDKLYFKEIHVNEDVIEEIINFALNAYPVEFVALLEGEVKNEILNVYGLIFLPGHASNEGASIDTWMLPNGYKKIGSVHSHPGFSNEPSEADYLMFSKEGIFHMIICEPFSYESIKAYDSYGNPVNFKII